MVVGSIIGAGIFVQPSEIARHLTTPGQSPSYRTASGRRTRAAAVRLALDFAGAERHLAGSDYPHQIDSIPLMLETIEKLDLSNETKRKILGENAAQLLTPHI